MEKAPNCNTCGNPMFEIGGIGKNEQIGEFGTNKIVGMREQKLY